METIEDKGQDFFRTLKQSPFPYIRIETVGTPYGEWRNFLPIPVRVFELEDEVNPVIHEENYPCIYGYIVCKKWDENEHTENEFDVPRTFENLYNDSVCDYQEHINVKITHPDRTFTYVITFICECFNYDLHHIESDDEYYLYGLKNTYRKLNYGNVVETIELCENMTYTLFGDLYKRILGKSVKDTVFYKPVSKVLQDIERAKKQVFKQNEDERRMGTNTRPEYFEEYEKHNIEVLQKFLKETQQHTPVFLSNVCIVQETDTNKEFSDFLDTLENQGSHMHIESHQYQYHISSSATYTSWDKYIPVPTMDDHRDIYGYIVCNPDEFTISHKETNLKHVYKSVLDRCSGRGYHIRNIIIVRKNKSRIYLITYSTSW